VSQTQLPHAQPYHPATFLERGVTIPFTTPFLGGTRVRPADKQCLELIVPNPSGGRGVYVVAWSGIMTLCRPTLHDKVFNSRLSQVHGVTPAVIRRIAQAIAAEGLAGEEAMEASQLAENAERDDQMITNYQMLMTLIEQHGPAPAAVPEQERQADQKRRAQQTIASVAPKFNRSTAWTASALEALAQVMTNTGMGANKTGRIPRFVEALRRTRTEITEWSRTQRRDDQQAYARMICSVADLTLSISSNVLSQVHALTDEMIGPLRTWALDPSLVIQLSSRPEWLLDGWQNICLIWDYAKDDAARRAALLEIIDLVPVLPKEARDWCDTPIDVDGTSRLRRSIRLNEDWRTGETVVNLIARNEHFRAVAC
jgi:hypothetical protein